MVNEEEGQQKYNPIDFFVFRRMGRVIEEKEFFNLVLAPLENFILFLAVYISMSSLQFPAILHFNIFKITSEVLVDRLAVGILIFSFSIPS